MFLPPYFHPLGGNENRNKRWLCAVQNRKTARKTYGEHRIKPPFLIRIPPTAPTEKSRKHEVFGTFYYADHSSAHFSEVRQIVLYRCAKRSGSRSGTAPYCQPIDRAHAPKYVRMVSIRWLWATRKGQRLSQWPQAMQSPARFSNVR